MQVFDNQRFIGLFFGWFINGMLVAQGLPAVPSLGCLATWSQGLVVFLLSRNTREERN